MIKAGSETHNTEPVTRVIPLPIALYSSNGLLFELYDGGQPRRSFAIRWETIKAIRVSDEHDHDCQQTPQTSQPA